MALSINDLNFEEQVTGSQKPVIVDFWATWCGPCRMISPIVDELADKYEGKVLIAKCNVDENTEVPMKYGIRNIPTLLFFKNGEMVDRLVGAVSKTDIENKINSLI
ncbi:MAG: thioredoxin [Bacteroidales bacterium]|nr:thioredoxin [Bacteroidales bacterium]MDD4670061.1 thioredoxin [Bacteroidales bacterium]